MFSQIFDIVLLDCYYGFLLFFYKHTKAVRGKCCQRYRWSACRPAAISGSHLSPLLSSFSLLYSSSSWVSVENSKLGPSTMASTGQASCEVPTESQIFNQHYSKGGLPGRSRSRCTLSCQCRNGWCVGCHRHGAQLQL